MDRSLASLPPALQSLTLYEYQGELVDGNRGVIDFADLLKRPLESYKYLLGTVEQGRVSLDVASLELDTVFIGSSNEGYLAAFKEVPEFQSFKGRMELVRVPYLLDYRVEQRIYDAQIRAAHSRVGQARRAARRLGHRAVGRADADEEAARREVRQEPVGHRRAARAAGEGAALRRQRHARGADHRAAARARRRHRQDRARVGQLPELRGAHRRLAARDEAADHERRAERPVQVPVAVRGVRRARGAGARRDRLRVPEAGAVAGRFPREPQVHLPGARQADRPDRRRGADLDGAGRRAPLHRSVRALRLPRILLGQAREGPQPHHRPRRGSRRGDDDRGRAHPARSPTGATSSAARSSRASAPGRSTTRARSPTTSRSSRARSPSCASRSSRSARSRSGRSTRTSWCC